MTTWLEQLTARASRLDWSRVVRADPCSWCGGPGGTLEHLQPRSHGGWSSPANIVGACPRCNGERGVQPILLYLIARQQGGRPVAQPHGLSRRLRPERMPPPPLRVTIAERLALPSPA